MKATPHTTIGLFDDHPLVLNGLQSLLSSEGYQITFTCTEPAELKSHIAKSVPDLLILDVVASGVQGLDVFRYVLEQHPTATVMAHTSLDSAILVTNLLGLGVRGYVSKRDNTEQLLGAVRALLQGDVFVPDEYAFLAKTAKPPQQPTNLSQREVEILNRIMVGKLSKEIAAELAIAENTVKNHRANLFAKFQVDNMAELLNKASQLGYRADHEPKSELM